MGADNQDDPMDVSLLADRIEAIAERRAELLERVRPPRRKKPSTPRHPRRKAGQAHDK